MEVSIICREIINPCLDEDREPFRISLIDQITPATYFPFIFFFPPKPDPSPEDSDSFAARLKSALRHALNRFYPFAGAVKDNLVVEDFHSGVPFLRGRASSTMASFLSEPKLTWLDHFLPCLPYRPPSSTTAQLAVQVTEFPGGGFAIGVCASHKLSDAACLISFINTWASKTRQDGGSDSDEDDPNDLSVLFPAEDPLPGSYASIGEKIYFSEGDFRTERFVFSPDALARLTDLASTDHQRFKKERPSRVQAVSGFIWKSVMAWSNSKARMSLMCQAVNLRRKDSNERRVGNKFWWSTAACGDEEPKLASLVDQLSQSVANTKEYFASHELRPEEAVASVGDNIRMVEGLCAVKEPEIYVFSSWVNLGLDDVDFGLGRAVWVGTSGKPGPTGRNLVVLKDETAKGKGMEAWITLEHKVMTKLRNDPHFLALASINPPIII